jgi:hypothetical protein
VKSIYKYVAAQRDSYRSDTIEITEGYEFSQYETLRTFELCDNDRFLTGPKDSLDREKPFFNIVSFRKNVATRATDLDTKDVQIQSDQMLSPLRPFDRTRKFKPMPKKCVRSSPQRRIWIPARG